MKKPSVLGRRPTSIDVAIAANVSQSTVSRALRGDPSISARTRERVVRIASGLSYYPDSRAARLRETSVGRLAVVLLYPERGARQPFNPFYYEIASAVEAAAARRGLSVLLSCQSQSSSLRCEFEQRKEADGIIVIGSAANRLGWEFYSRRYEDGANIVAWGTPDDRLPTIRADNLYAGALAGRHLLSIGRQHLAFLGPGSTSHLAFRLRGEGFGAELERNGVTPLAIGFEPDGNDRAVQGEAWIGRALATFPQLDGVFAASDALAAGVIRGLVLEGRQVPDDIAVIGFDGGYGAGYFSPSLTTIEQDIAIAGELLVRAVMADPGSSKSDPQSVPVRLILRESTCHKLQSDS